MRSFRSSCITEYLYEKNEMCFACLYKTKHKCGKCASKLFENALFEEVRGRAGRAGTTPRTFKYSLCEKTYLNI